ncbi:MAG: ABC transporter ATP-binding protein [Anaerolineae bacterium]|nr:ABC transporter ATP-binding protein [Anaerolineae bacterium]
MTEKLPLLEISNLHKRYGRNHILRGISFVVQAGEIVGIVGENGTGKSTVMKAVVGLLPCDKGEISVRGRIGYCPQDPVTYDLLTMRENFTYFGAAYGLAKKLLDQRMGILMEQLGCTRYADTRVCELSGGTRQKANLIIALLHDPEVLLLDEPYQGFDYATYLSFWALSQELRSQGKAIIVVSHMITERHHFNRIIRLENGYAYVER